MGEYFPYLVVNDCIVLELMAAAGLCENHELQLANYLKATDIEIGLLLNFGQKPEFRRKLWVKHKTLRISPINSGG